jgi:hypothetical protein
MYGAVERKAGLDEGSMAVPVVDPALSPTI